MQKPKPVAQTTSIDTCKQMTDLILSYLNNRLGRRLKREFEQHLRICPDCVNFLNTYKKTRALAGSLSLGEMPEVVRGKVLSFLRRKMHGVAVFFFSLIAQATS